MATLSDAAAVQRLLPYVFQDPTWLCHALTAGDSERDDREGHRGMAQLGDGLTNSIILTVGFCQGMPRSVQQDSLSFLKSKETCSMLARSLGLDRHVLISDRQSHLGPQPTVLKNTLAAILAAVFLESRDMRAVARVMEAFGLVNDAEQYFVPNDGSSLSLIEDSSMDFEAHQTVRLSDVMFNTAVYNDLSSSSEAPVEMQTTGVNDILDDIHAQSYRHYLKQASECFKEHMLPMSGIDAASSQVDSEPHPVPPNADIYHTVLEGREENPTETPAPETTSSASSNFAEGSLGCKNALEIMASAIGHASAFQLLKHTIDLIRHEDIPTIPREMPIHDRLRVIDLLGGRMANDRLARRLHIFLLYENIAREIISENSDSFISVNPDRETTPRGELRRLGNPRNLEQADITKRLMDVPVSVAEGIKAPKPSRNSMNRLRRVGRGLHSLVRRWGIGILPLLGLGFTDERLIKVRNMDLDRFIDVVDQTDGPRLRQLCEATSPAIEIIMNGHAPASFRLMIEDTDAALIDSLPRLSHAMQNLLTRVS